MWTFLLLPFLRQLLLSNKLVSWDRPEHFLRLFISQGLMGSFPVIKIHIILYLVIQLQTVIGGFKINFLIFEAPPEPFDKNIVNRASLAIHAELEIRMQNEVSGKIRTGELASLVSVQYLGGAMAFYGLFKAPPAPPGGHRVR